MQKIFISGSANITELLREVKEFLYCSCMSNDTILVGDCKGIDTLIQTFLKENGYKNVIVYAAGNRIRNFLGDGLGWSIKYINVPWGATGRDFYAAKDKAMAESCDVGYAVWDGKSKGTYNNIKYFYQLDKQVTIFRTDLQ